MQGQTHQPRPVTDETPRPEAEVPHADTWVGQSRLRLRRALAGVHWDGLARLWPRLRPELDWRLNVSVFRRALVAGVLVLYGLVTVLGFWRAFTVELPEDDRGAELSRLQVQLTEERTRTVRLESELDAFDKRREIRMSAIRSELGMLRPDERFVTFR